MFHYSGFFLKGDRGNNHFAYAERGEDAQLWVAPLHEGCLSELHVGDQPAFAECSEKGEVESYPGLATFLSFEYQGVPVYVFDNHNHALYFWYLHYFKGDFSKGIPLLHIDQHSDMKENYYQLEDADLDQVFSFVNEQCTVGNFIRPALASGLISRVDQLRTEGSLLHAPQELGDYLLDIDMDFWVKEMGIDKQETFEKTRQLARNAQLITVATSPYFMDQEEAIGLIQELFGE